ncbi:MAG: NADPH:quinone oxidoreductase family protein [Candidatus Hydrogenedentes bacterium]|nr:NADPH:quinone oxidoreductase family protein [Candidatus Hydrogenedentota bacterium]
MLAWRLHQFGDLEDLGLDEVETPAPGRGEVLLKVERAALNPADRYMIRGQYPKPAPLPFSVGRDACGVVVQPMERGSFKEGARAVLLRSDLGVSRTGTLAEYVAVPEESLAPLPPGWSPEEGAAAPLTFLTAYQALFSRGELKAGETVLVTGASGGVGTAAIMLAKAAEARVVALSRSEEKRAQLQVLGADFVIDSGIEAWEEAVKRALDGGRVNLVVENLGGPFLQKSINLLAFEGRVMLVGLLAGLKSEVVLGLLIHKCARLQGLSVSAYSVAESQQAWSNILALLEKEDRRPLVDRVFPLTQVPAAFEHLASGPLGKVVIDVTA